MILLKMTISEKKNSRAISHFLNAVCRKNIQFIENHEYHQKIGKELNKALHNQRNIDKKNT